MEMKTVAGAALFVIVLVVVAFAVIGKSGGNAGSVSGNANSTTINATANTTKTLFATSRIAPYSYLVSTKNLSSQAQAALAGYKLERVEEPDGSMNITISVNGTTESQSVVIRPGYRLYIVESSFGDDSGSFDSSLADDGFVLVDPQGYLV